MKFKSNSSTRALALAGACSAALAIAVPGTSLAVSGPAAGGTPAGAQYAVTPSGGGAGGQPVTLSGAPGAANSTDSSASPNSVTPSTTTPGTALKETSTSNGDSRGNGGDSEGVSPATSTNSGSDDAGAAPTAAEQSKAASSSSGSDNGVLPFTGFNAALVAAAGLALLLGGAFLRRTGRASH